MPKRRLQWQQPCAGCALVLHRHDELIGTSALASAAASLLRRAGNSSVSRRRQHGVSNETVLPPQVFSDSKSPGGPVSAGSLVGSREHGFHIKFLKNDDVGHRAACPHR